jgi:hypothetical protein
VSLRRIDPDQPHIDFLSRFEANVEGVAIDRPNDEGAGPFSEGSRLRRRRWRRLRRRLRAPTTRGGRAGTRKRLAGNPVTVTVQAVGVAGKKLALGFGLIGEIRAVVVGGTSGSGATRKAHSGEASDKSRDGRCPSHSTSLGETKAAEGIRTLDLLSDKGLGGRP